jgi:hypothetical protein
VPLLDEFASSPRVGGLQQRTQRRARGEDAVELLVFSFVIEREHHDVFELRGKFLRGSVNCSERHGLAPAFTDVLGELPLVIARSVGQEDLRVTPLGGSDVVDVTVCVARILSTCSCVRTSRSGGNVRYCR